LHAGLSGAACRPCFCLRRFRQDLLRIFPAFPAAGVRKVLAMKEKTAQPAADLDTAEIKTLLEELLALRAELVASPANPRHYLDPVHANYRKSALNLQHYLALRRRDLRPLQLRLASLGLSSIGRAESHVLATVDAILKVLHQLARRRWQAPTVSDAEKICFRDGQRLLGEHTRSLLGPASHERGVRIMVTMPSEAADDYTLIENLLHRGMNCMRINCAHDDADKWLRMINNLRRAEQALGLPCKIVMDLAGPKLRTGPLEPGPAVVRIRPRRDVCGRVVAPARVWMTPEGALLSPPTSADATLQLPEAWLGRLHIGEELKFSDARGSGRALTIVDVTGEGCWAELVQTAYVVPGTVLRRRGKAASEAEAAVGSVPFRDGVLTLQQGDLLILTLDSRPGRPATKDSAGQVLTPAMIGCTIPAVFTDVRSGEQIWFDDGKIGGVIEKVETGRIHIRITRAPLQGGRLRGDKGINLPESNFRLAAMTAKDLDDLAFVAGHADVVELSFANTAHDVEELQQHLENLGTRQPAIVLKIETRRAFENLPDMLFTAMRSPCCGVMIARGDLAVECGFERLAEIQEEILWICEAAHVPVIWATQVLEGLAKTGMPSRAEITDAAMGDRAECVMLNKGPHVVNAVRVLDDILRRMQAHQAKKLAMLRELRLAHR
jgi:pyruvate kinase